MDKLFTGNYDNDDENQTEKDEINELLDLLNGMKAEEEPSPDEDELVEEDIIKNLFAEDEDAIVDEGIQYDNILEEFEELENQEEKKQEKGKINFLEKIKDLLFQKVDLEKEEADENERILKELEKATKKSEKKAKSLKDKEAKKAVRREASQNRKAARVQALEKIKKAKKPQAPKEPEETIRVTPVFMVLMMTIVVGIIITIIVGGNSYSYNLSFQSAKDNFFSQKYELAYEQIAGLTPRKEDEVIYRQIMTIMYVEKQYLSYENYMDLGMELEALNSLIKGIERYDTYKLEANSLGVSNDMAFVFSNITTALSNDFGLSEEFARGLNLVTDSTEYTKELYSLLGYN